MWYIYILEYYSVKSIGCDGTGAWWLHVQETGIETIPKKKKCKKAKWLSEEALQIAVTRRDQKLRTKGKIYPFEGRVPKNSKERYESLPQ